MATRLRDLALLIGVVLSLLASRSAAAAPDPAALRESDTSRPEWGTQDRILAHIGFNEFSPVHAGTSFTTRDPVTGNFGLYSVGEAAGFAAIAHVPSGALLTYLELDYCNADPAASDVELLVFRCTYLGTGCVPMSSLQSLNGLKGCHIVTADLTSQAFTMDNNAYELVLDVTTLAGDSTTTFSGAYIGYKLQISPAPTAATFADVPTSHPYFRAIEALAKSGITGGCGNGNFCPGGNVTRGEMAAFLARAFGLHFPN